MSAGTKNGPDDVGRSTEHRGSAAGTPGLSPLDEEREASLADEGGASGATIESQDAPARDKLTHSKSGMVPRSESRRRRPNFWVVAGAIAAGALGVLAMRKKQR